ncbi:hypothetical protein CUC53_13950 [Aeromonas cavernicola]|uniref:Uncharacterized protein n=1 Tax=Aeromonas cavernicola TaxID=1006623 RepID=A0A2H9U266_9GAMM|nr:hypothetical protein CUC53_13950 [Aeromonas cavernicola]
MASPDGVGCSYDAKEGAYKTSIYIECSSLQLQEWIVGMMVMVPTELTHLIRQDGRLTDHALKRMAAP